MAKFRILSLDGGGVRGAFSVAVLAQLEQALGKPIADHFDLIAGTSTGAIIGVALALGAPARRIREFYEKEGPEIFPTSLWRQRVGASLRHLVRPKHRPQRLQAALQAILGDKVLDDARTRLVIPAYDPVAGDIRVFKTSHDPAVRHPENLPAVEVVMASSAAPTYFPASLFNTGETYLDGGVWAPCPAAVAAVEAIGVLGQHPDHLDMLSIGTTEEPFHIPARLRTVGGLLPYLRGNLLARLLNQGQVRSALAMATVLCRHQVLRISNITTPGRFRMDDAQMIRDLTALGVREARRQEHAVADRFFQEPAPPFHPVA